MTKPVSLLLGVHAHQPAGTFPVVLERAHTLCYRPFLQTLERYPEFKFAAHFSGWLLQWLFDHHPQDMALLRSMVERGQAELFGGGDTEPVLAAIPTRDRIGQIRALSDRLERLVGCRPKGGWLTERVWESSVVPALADAGVQYVAVDDYHFLCAGRGAEELGGHFCTEEDGRSLGLFPISEALRYRIPFSTATEAVAFIERQAQNNPGSAAVYFDDIEKFGIWPHTYEWVYQKGWLQQFIEAVLSSATVRTQHFGEYRAETRSRGLVYLPATSYIEMNEWTLPAERAHAYARLVKQEQDHGRYDRDKAFLRGGIWRNFLSRYSEANWMHKRMLELSARLDGQPVAAETGRLRELLYRAQANDAYWHGLFGGLYLPHLRRAVYSALVELEGALDRTAPRPATSRLDADMDGVDEVFAHNPILQLVVRCDSDAAIIELDSFTLRHNFGDTLRRREEHYYSKMHVGEHQHFHHEGIASAHDRISFKHAIAPADVSPDPRPRSLFLDLWRRGDHAAWPAYAGQPGTGLEFSGSCDSLAVVKAVELSDNRVTVRYRLHAHMPGRFETELNLAMPSCDGVLGRYVFEGEIPGGFGQAVTLPSMTMLSLEDGVLGGTVAVLCSPPAALDAGPHHTVSQSEDGFEKIMQAVTLRLVWNVETGDSVVTVALEIRRA